MTKGILATERYIKHILFLSNGKSNRDYKKTNCYVLFQTKQKKGYTVVFPTAEEKEKKKEDSTARSREVTQPSTDVARDCLISRFGVELDVSSRVWPLHKNNLSLTLIYF